MLGSIGKQSGESVESVLKRCALHVLYKCASTSNSNLVSAIPWPPSNI